jgi:diacylglycerol kinase (ATP)
MENNPRKGFSPSRFIKGFAYAFSGIAKVFISEQNFRFHTFATFVVVATGFYFNVSKNEWIALVFAIGAVLTAEAFNSAVEKLVDMVSPQQHPQAGWIKDVAAGAVLLISIATAIVGLVVFVPYIF